MEKLVLNEMEAIQLTIEHGYEGEELELSCWKKNGSLDGKKDKVTGEFKERNMIKFIRKLETIYEHVEVIGKGKKRQYILSNKKETMSEMQDDRKTAQQDDDDELMAKHLYNYLLNLNNNYPRTLNKWTIEIGGLNPKAITKELIYDCFDEMYYGADLSNIYHSITEYIKQRNEKVASKSIKILKQKGLINVYEVYQAITTDNRYITIEKDTYEEWKNQFKEIVHKYDFEMKNYKFHINKEENKEFKEEIEKFQNESGIKTTYIAYDIQSSTKLNQFNEVSYIDFQTTYNDKMIKLINQLPKCKKEHQLFFSARFKKFNYLYILKNANWTIHIDDKLLEELKPNPIYIDLIIHERKNHKGMENIVERWRKTTDSFGALLEGDITLDEFDSNTVVVKQSHSGKVDSEKFNINSMTIDDYISDIEIEDVELEPYIPETYKFIPMDNIHNNKQLANAIDMIKIAFKQPMGVANYSATSF